MSKKILIVEDNPQNMKVMRLTLRPLGCEVFEATDGEQGVEVARREKPDLILMDVQLPKMNGLDATRAIRSYDELKRTRIVAITAYARKADKDKAIAAGCDAYISKPINTRDVRGVVAGLMRGVKVD